tara:strand:+ start:1312 stop:1953 length:642 start_codon:yes stop_codon:yes gene_type:complete
MLPGLYNPSGVGAFSVAYVSNTTYNTYNGTLTMPTLEVGDVILAIAYAWRNGPFIPSPAYGTGFTAMQTNGVQYAIGLGDYGARMCTSYRVAQSGDSGSTIGGFINDDTESATIAVYRPSAAITTVTPLDLSTSISGDPPASTITASGSSLWTISWAAVRGSTLSFTPTEDFEALTGGLRVKAIVQGPTASNVTANAGSGTGIVYADGYMEVS